MFNNFANSGNFGISTWKLLTLNDHKVIQRLTILIVSEKRQRMTKGAVIVL